MDRDQTGGRCTLVSVKSTKTGDDLKDEDLGHPEEYKQPRVLEQQVFTCKTKL